MEGVKGRHSFIEGIGNAFIFLNIPIGFSGLGRIFACFAGDPGIVELNEGQLVQGFTNTGHNCKGRRKKVIKPSLNIGNDIMEGGSDIGSTSPQSVPDTQGNIRHGQAKVFEEGNHNHDSPANHTEAAICNSGELGNCRTRRIDSRNDGDNQKDDPCKGASQKRRI